MYKCARFACLCALSMHAPSAVRAALRHHVLCPQCNAVRSNLYVRRGCKHVICSTCFPSAPKCFCGKRSSKPPLPVDGITRDVLRCVFGKSPSDAEQLKAGIVADAERVVHTIRVSDYIRKLKTELDTLEDVVNAVRCGCGLVCVRRTTVAGSRMFYGCPRWSPADKSGACGFFQWLSRSQH